MIRDRKVLRTAGKLLLSTVFFLALLEIAIRLVAPVERLALTPNMYDPVLGIRMEPNFTGFIRCPEYEIKLAVNSQGLRDREYPLAKPAGRRRILCLGDSFTVGFGVAAEETYPKILEKLLNGVDATGGRWDVINAGVAATGTAHQLAYFETEGYKWQPDVTIVGFVINDFWDSLTSGLYARQDGELVRQAVPATWQLKIRRWTRWIPGYSTLFANSHALNTLKHLLAKVHYRNLAREVKTAGDPEAERKRQIDFTIDLLSQLQQSCGRHGSELVLMLIPPVVEDAADQRQCTDLVARAQQLDIPCLDLRPQFNRLQNEGVQTFYPEDGHWNATGHALFGESLFRFLQDHLVQSAD